LEGITEGVDSGEDLKLRISFQGLGKTTDLLQARSEQLLDIPSKLWYDFFDMVDKQNANVRHECRDPKTPTISSPAPRCGRIEIVCCDALER
jgi:hypothetical protein